MTDTLFHFDALEADALEIIKGSQFAELLKQGLKFNWRDFSGDLAEIKALAPVVVAAIQVAKENLKTRYPNEDWNHIAIETAAKILRDSIELPGWWRGVQLFLLGPVLRGFLEGALGTFKVLVTNKSWLALARAALALAV